jgi:hypothetical protein
MVCSRQNISTGDDIAVSADKKTLALINGISFSIIAKDSDDRRLNPLDNV